VDGDRVVTELDVVVVCGPARSGSTTVAVALGLVAARRGLRAVVVTVDPTARVAREAGIDRHEPGRPVRVDGSLSDDAGELWLERLDITSTFDGLVRAVADDEEQAFSLSENPLYSTLTTSLPGAGDFMALERLVQLHEGGEWDLVILDTPPSEPAGAFLSARERVLGFLDHPVYRALTIGRRTFGRVADAALSSFLGSVKRVAGSQVADDTTAFFRSFAEMEPGLRVRLAAAIDLLRADTSGFVVVSSARPEAIRETLHLGERVTSESTVRGLVVNRVIAPLDDGSAEYVTSEWLNGVLDAQAERIADLWAALPEALAIEVPDTPGGVGDAASFDALARSLAELGEALMVRQGHD